MQSHSNLYVSTDPSSSQQYGNGYSNSSSHNGYNNNNNHNGYNNNYSYATSNANQTTGAPSPANASVNSSSSTSPTKRSFSSRMKKYDFQPSIPSEFRVYTTHGAILSLTTVLLLLYLSYTEYNYNLTYTTKERVHVMDIDHHSAESSSTSTSRFFLNNHNYKSDNGFNQKAENEQHRIEMEIDITFPNIACPLLSVDAMDPNNQRQSLHLDNTHRVWKHRVKTDEKTGALKYIGKRSKFELGMTLQSEGHVEEYAANKKLKFIKDQKRKMEEVNGEDDMYYDDTDGHGDDQQVVDCGSCYGAGDDGECCNTCDDVKRAYQRKGWVFEPNLDVKQCHNELKGDALNGEGCNVHGIVALSPGGGNLHITPGHEMENFGKTFHFQDLQDLIKQAFETFDVTHTVEKLRFGSGYPGDIHQLDGAERNVTDSFGMYQYYFQIVPTEYRFLNGTVIKTNQYSVIEHMRHVQPGSKRGLPGVYFFYEVSPLHVQIEEYRHGWIRFLTSVAAVVGGVFSAMRMMDAFIFSKSSGGRNTLSPF